MLSTPNSGAVCAERFLCSAALFVGHCQVCVSALLAIRGGGGGVIIG